jgi:hypothetical protein
MKTALIYLMAMFTTVDPPAGDPPAGDPPAGDPPAGDPPAGDPPAGDPPAAWYAGLEGITPEQAEAFKGLSTADVIAKLTAQAPVVPETYALPEGVEADQLDPEVFGGFQEMAREIGLTQEQMNALVNFDIARQASFSEEMHAHNKRIFADGLAQMKQDLGAQEAQRTFSLAKATMRAFADEGLRTFLDSTGLGDSPDMIRLFAKIGAAISEDSFSFDPKGSGGKDTTPASKLYPSMQPK